MDEILDKLMLEYQEMFDEEFPTFQILRGRTDEEGIEIAKECLEKGKTVYELGYCTLDEGVQY